MTHTDYARATMDWDQGPTEPIVQWQNRPPQTVPPSGVAVGVVTLAVCALGAFALGLLFSERLNERSPIRWR